MERVIEMHRNANDGNYPERRAVPLSGLDNVKTKSESVGIALGLIGAEQIIDGTGRVVRLNSLTWRSSGGRVLISISCSTSPAFSGTHLNTLFSFWTICVAEQQ